MSLTLKFKHAGFNIKHNCSLFIGIFIKYLFNLDKFYILVYNKLAYEKILWLSAS